MPTKHPIRNRSLRTRKRFRPPRTAADYFARSPKVRDQYDASLHALSMMRNRGLSLTRAAAEAGVQPSAVKKMVGRALRKDKRGHYRAKPTDRLLRMMNAPDDQGARTIVTRDYREAQVIARWWQAVGIFQRTGDPTVLKKFPRKTVKDASGKRVRLLLDPDKLLLLSGAGLLNPESIYAHAL